MKWSRAIGEYLKFTRKDRVGLGILSLLLLSVVIIPRWLPAPSLPAVPLQDSTRFIPLSPKNRDDQDEKQRDNGGYKKYQPENRYTDKTEPAARPVLFYFDPNTLDAAGWARLGLKPGTITIIRHFLEKGGKFRKPEDLLKIYGLKKERAEELIPYVQIEAKTVTDKIEVTYPDQIHKPAPEYKPLPIDINTADSSAWEKLPGIGARLSSRIVHFRESLGGFYSVDQVKETFGLADSVFQKIKPMLHFTPADLRTIDINNCTMDELKKHPYLRWNLAKAIVAYREAHGKFSNAADLKKIMAMNDETIEKIKPYLRF